MATDQDSAELESVPVVAGSLCGRADLMRAFLQGGPDLLAATARALGFEQRQLDVKNEYVLASPIQLHVTATVEAKATVIKKAVPIPSPTGEYLVLSKYESLDSDGQDNKKSSIHRPLADITTPAPPVPAKTAPLTPWRTLLPGLRRLMAQNTPGEEIDIPAVVRHIGQGRQLDCLPRKSRSGWCRRLHVIVDRTVHLTPFWSDQNLVFAQLTKLFPEHEIKRTLFWQGYDLDILWQTIRQEGAPGQPGSVVVLVLGDLGQLSGEPEKQALYWEQLARRIMAAGLRPVALTPCPRQRWSPGLEKRWQLLPWERTTELARLDEEQLQTRVERLLRLVSVTQRLEPGFVRGVRRLLASHEADAGTESDLWQHASMLSPSSVAATLDSDAIKGLRSEFAKEDEQLQKQIFALLWQWHHKLHPAVEIGEMAFLAADSKKLMPKDRLEAAHEWLESLGACFVGESKESVPDGAMVWFKRYQQWLVDDNWRDPATAKSLHRMMYHIQKNEPDKVRPPGFKPEYIPSDANRPIEEIFLHQVGGDIMLYSQPQERLLGSPLATIHSRNRLMTIRDRPDLAHPPSGCQTLHRSGRMLGVGMFTGRGSLFRWLGSLKKCAGYPRDLS